VLDRNDRARDAREVFVARLSASPRVAPIPTPRICPQAMRVIEQKRRLIAMTANQRDDPILWTASVGANSLEVFPATYAWSLAIPELTRHHPELRYGNLGVAAIVRRPDGSVLWQRRAGHLLDGGGRWTFSATGGMRPGDDPRDLVLDELDGELGISASQLLSLRPIALAQAPQASTDIVFLADAPSDLEVAPRRAEVADAVWRRSPSGLTPHYNGLGATWTLLRPLLEAGED
jgi:8-oxo-dGTP pyrophosphatase MutT (NUDIX family)